MKGGDKCLPHILKQLYVCCNCHELGVLVNIGCSLVCFFLPPWHNFIASASKNGRGLCCWSKAIWRNTRQETQKKTFSFHSQYCLTPLLHHLFVTSLPTPGTTDTDFVDTFLAFWKGVLLLITTFCIINVFLCALIFYQPVWTPKATFQTVENNFPDRASIFRQLTFFTFHWTYFILQRWMGKC